MQQSGYWTATSWQVFNTGTSWAKALRHCPGGCLKINKKIWVFFSLFPTDTYILKYCPALTFFVASVFYSSLPVVAPNLSTPLRSPVFPFLFLQTILSLPLSSVPPQVVASTEHCIVPCYLFLKASSLLGACDIRGLTEHQPVARGGYCLTGWARSPVSLLAPSVCLLGHSSRAWSEHERLGLGERGSSRNDENIGCRQTEKKWDWMTVWADSSRLWGP